MWPNCLTSRILLNSNDFKEKIHHRSDSSPTTSSPLPDIQICAGNALGTQVDAVEFILRTVDFLVSGEPAVISISSPCAKEDSAERGRPHTSHTNKMTQIKPVTAFFENGYSFA
jgi:hypothetical protein